MPRLEPFTGLRYAPGTDHDAVTSPPYDVIDADERAALARKSNTNAVLFDLPDEADGDGRYAAAAAMVEQLRGDKVLVEDDQPAFYVYRMSYADEQGRPRHTTGVIGALELSRPGEGGILPHEHTTPKAKSDRLDLLRATGANLSPIWGLSPAAGLTALLSVSGEPAARATDDDGVVHELWPVTESARIDGIRAAIAGHPVVIADGHHRYETSLTYRDERQRTDGAGPWDLTMIYVVELTEDELAVRPIHRLLRGTPGGDDLVEALGAALFDVTPTEADVDLPARMDEAGALGLVLPGGSGYLLRPRQGAFPDDLPDLDSSRLDVALSTLPAMDVEYQHGTETVLRRVSAGEATAGVLLRPVSVAQIRRTADTGERMPPKSTFFWPKPRTGFVFRLM